MLAQYVDFTVKMAVRLSFQIVTEFCVACALKCFFQLNVCNIATQIPMISKRLAIFVLFYFRRKAQPDYDGIQLETTQKREQIIMYMRLLSVLYCIILVGVKYIVYLFIMNLNCYVKVYRFNYMYNIGISQFVLLFQCLFSLFLG